MPKIIQLSPHIANLIAAGEVVERPASVVKELLENAVDAGASKVTVEIRDGGMTFIRVTDDGCGMSTEDARTAFLRHATSKLRSAEDLAAISTMGFRGEALAAIASVSRIDLLTKKPSSLSGISLVLEAGKIIEESEAGCPDGTTIIVRDLFYNTPARMKFMKADTVEGAKVSAAVQLQALAHPEVAFRFLRDGKEVLSTPGTGDLESAVYCVYGRDGGKMIRVDSRWDSYSLSGYVSKPTDSRPSRSLQTFFVNERPVKSKILIAALEEAYRNQIMIGKFPACVLHLTLPANTVDVNVHPAKTEVKFLNEKAVFDCVHYGVLAALNKTPDRPQVQFKQTPTPNSSPTKPMAQENVTPKIKQDSFFRTMSAQEFKQFTAAISDAPQPKVESANATYLKVERELPQKLCEPILIPVNNSISATKSVIPDHDPKQEEIRMPEVIPWRIVGELYKSYIIVEEGDEAFLIDKHAAHERILFDKLKANQEVITAQNLISPIPCRLSPDSIGILISSKDIMTSLGFELDSFGENTILVRQIPMDLSIEDVSDVLDELASELLNGRHEKGNTIRDELLHTVACKAAIKAGWKTNEVELRALVKTVMENDDLKYCPHGRPICISLNKKQLEKQFKRT